MMLFIDDLPLQIGDYYPLGTNNIVLNRSLVDIVEVKLKNRRMVNALVYNLLLREYPYVLEKISEKEARHQVQSAAIKCFGEDHTAKILARKSPWVLLKDIPFEAHLPPKRAMQIVHNFEKSDIYIT
jgi:hypothetical protein